MKQARFQKLCRRYNDGGAQPPAADSPATPPGAPPATPPQTPPPANPPPPNYAELAKTDPGLQEFLTQATQSAVQAAVEKERLLADEKVSEADKLAKMTAAEKQTYELQKLQKQVTSYEQEKAVLALKSQALKIAGEKGVPAALVDLLPFAGMKAEEVTAQIDAVKGVYDTAVKAGIAQALNGAGTPASAGGAPGVFTKEQIEKMTPDEINKNWPAIQAGMMKGEI